MTFYLFFLFLFFNKEKTLLNDQTSQGPCLPFWPGATSNPMGLAGVPRSPQPMDSSTHLLEDESESQGEQEHIAEHDKYASKIFKNQITQIMLILRGSFCQGSLVLQSA